MSEEVLPRDMKIVHLILASMGVTSYQDHVPLQLLDFAYRYTTQVFQDALVYSDYAHQSGASQPAGMGSQNAPLTVDDVKLAVSSRVAYQFKPTTPKDLLMSLAAERNKRALPPVSSSYGLRLPPEKHCLTGRERDIDSDDDVVIAGYEKIDLSDSASPEKDTEGEENEEQEQEQEQKREQEQEPEQGQEQEQKQEQEHEGEHEGEHEQEQQRETEEQGEESMDVENEENMKQEAHIPDNKDNDEAAGLNDEKDENDMDTS